VLGAIFHLFGAVTQHESAAEEGKKVVLVMLAVGGVFLLVIAVGELSHHVAKARRRRDG
jgi:hypothetical protein